MFKRILVPLDGSGRAERALPIAARLARATGGSIFLVRVLSTEPARLPSALRPMRKPGSARRLGSPILYRPLGRRIGPWPKATWQGWLSLSF